MIQKLLYFDFLLEKVNCIISSNFLSFKWFIIKNLKYSLYLTLIINQFFFLKISLADIYKTSYILDTQKYFTIFYY